MDTQYGTKHSLYGFVFTLTLTFKNKEIFNFFQFFFYFNFFFQFFFRTVYIRCPSRAVINFFFLINFSSISLLFFSLILGILCSKHAGILIVFIFFIELFTNWWWSMGGKKCNITCWHWCNGRCNGFQRRSASWCACRYRLERLALHLSSVLWKPIRFYHLVIQLQLFSSFNPFKQVPALFFNDKLDFFFVKFFSFRTIYLIF